MKKRSLLNQVFDRIAVSFIGLLVMMLLEGILTLGMVFKFEEYGWFGIMLQCMIIFITVWFSNRAYEAELR